MAKPQWKQYTVTEGTSYWDRKSFTARVSVSGVGARAKEHWQIQRKTELYLGWLSVESAIEALQNASTGLVEADLEVSTHNSYGDETITSIVSGWSDELTDEELAKVKAHVQDLAKAEEEKAEAAAQAERAKLIELAAKYPELLEKSAN